MSSPQGTRRKAPVLVLEVARLGVRELDMTELVDEAVGYGARGWLVLPCKPGGKTPLTAHGLKDATSDAEQIRQWWARWPDANIGIATGTGSGLVAVDVDGKDGEETLELVEGVHGELPETVKAITGGDGWHYLYAHPGVEMRNTAGRLGTGIDTRGDGGYIIVPPSVHPSGRRYEWVTGPDAVPLATLPGWMVETLQAAPGAPRERQTAPVSANGHRCPPTTQGPITAYAAKVLDERKAEVAHAPAGTRNDRLNQAAFRLGQLVEGGQMGRGFVTEELIGAALSVGLPETEARRTIESGLDAGARQPQYPDPTPIRRARVTTSAASTSTTAAPPKVSAGELADGSRDTDVGNADRFIAAAGGTVRYVHAWARWIVYDETAGVWRVDHGNALVTEAAKGVARTMFRTAAELNGDTRDRLWKWAKRSETAAAIANMVGLARGMPSVLVAHEELDAKPWLLNVANGTIDLRAGELRSHDPDDLLTVQAPTIYDEAAAAPLWASCLQRWQPDPAVRLFLQKVVGTGATGHPIEALFINVGPGGNGKGKFYGAIAHTLGDYVIVPHKSLLTVQRHEQHDTVKARFYGARLAIASETDAADRLDEAKVKELTGGDRLEARRMREDPWQFRPSHTMVMHTNHRPKIRGTDEGVWRRIRLIPWTVTIPIEERDEELATKLEAESSGILNWILDGYASWRLEGFAEPAPVVEATAEYRSAQDVLAAFLVDCFELVAGHRESTREIVETYERWCESTGETPMTRTAFGRALDDRGIDLTRDRRYRVGLRLLRYQE